MTTPPDSDSALNAAVRLAGPAFGHALLGCDWGTKVASTDDRTVCIRQARQRVVLHGPGGERYEVKVCREHAVAIDLETDPHDDPEDNDGNE